MHEAIPHPSNSGHEEAHHHLPENTDETESTSREAFQDKIEEYTDQIFDHLKSQFDQITVEPLNLHLESRGRIEQLREENIAYREAAIHELEQIRSSFRGLGINLSFEGQDSTHDGRKLQQIGSYIAGARRVLKKFNKLIELDPEFSLLKEYGLVSHEIYGREYDETTGKPKLVTETHIDPLKLRQNPALDDLSDPLETKAHLLARFRAYQRLYSEKVTELSTKAHVITYGEFEYNRELIGDLPNSDFADPAYTNPNYLVIRQPISLETRRKQR